MKGQTSGLLLGGGTESPLLDTKVYSKSCSTTDSLAISANTIRKVDIHIPPKCIFAIKGRIIATRTSKIPDSMILTNLEIGNLADYTNLLKEEYAYIWKEVQSYRNSNGTAIIDIIYNDINVSSELSELYLYMYYSNSGTIIYDDTQIHYRSISEDNDLSAWSGAAPTVSTITT